MHQSAPNFATSRGAKMLTEEIEKATNGELKMQLHLSGTLQISPTDITKAVGENIVQIGDDLFNSGNIPRGRHSAPADACSILRRLQQSRGSAPTLHREGVCGQGLDRARSLQLSDAGRVGKKEAGILGRHQGSEAARGRARAGRVRAPLRRHLDHHERAGSSFRARSRRGRRHLHRRRRRRALEGPV